MNYTPADLAQHTYNFLHQHGYPVAQYSTRFLPQPLSSGRIAQAVTLHDGSQPWLEFGPDSGVNELAARMGTRGRLNERQLRGANTLLHEGLHMMRVPRGGHAITTEDVGGVGSARYWEEAATEAVARDLLPHFTRKMFGDRLPNVPQYRPGYQDNVRHLRQLSTFGSGGGKWQSVPARQWRRTFQHSDYATKQQMVDQAMAARAEWGQRTGR